MCKREPFFPDDLVDQASLFLDKLFRKTTPYLLINSKPLSLRFPIVDLQILDVVPQAFIAAILTLTPQFNQPQLIILSKSIFLYLMKTITAELSKPISSCSSNFNFPAATSTSRSVTINGSHEFKINGYSLTKGIGIGNSLSSDAFIAGGYQWAIHFYPDGRAVEDHARYVSLFIALESEDSDVRALFEISLIDQSGKGRNEVHTQFGRIGTNLESGPYTIKCRGSMW